MFGINSKFNVQLSKFFFDRTFLHSGARGDIVLSLPAIKMLGGGVLFIEATGVYCVFGGKPISLQEIQHFKEVFIKCDYIKDVLPYKKEIVNYNLNRFRLEKNLTTTHLTKSHCNAFNVKFDLNQPWLNKNDYNKKFLNNIIINHTMRYEGLITNWSDLKEFEKHITFIGHEFEYTNFIKKTKLNIQYYKVKSFLEIVEILNACSLYIGNQSFIYTFAEAMKIPRILSICPYAPSCPPTYNTSSILSKEIVSKFI